MKKTLYLCVSGTGWTAFQYEKLSDLKTEFEKRGIYVSDSATIGDYATIGYSAKIGNSAKMGLHYLRESLFYF